MAVNNCLLSLSSLLKSIVDVDIKVEDFHLARSDDKNASTIMLLWRILHGLKYCEESHAENVKSNELVHCIKYKLFESGYKRWQFFVLPDDFSCGCWELLIALAWMIGNHSLEKKIDGMLLKYYYLCGTSKVYDPEKEQSAMTDMDKVDYAFHISGKINLYLKLIEEFQSEKEKIKNKLLKEVKSLREEDSNPKPLIIANIECYEHDICKLLSLYIEWMKNAEYFFEWMETEVMNIPLKTSKEFPKEEQINEFYANIRISTRNTIEEDAIEYVEGATGYTDRRLGICTRTKNDKESKEIYDANQDEGLVEGAEEMYTIVQENNNLLEIINCEINKINHNLQSVQSYFVVDK